MTGSRQNGAGQNSTGQSGQENGQEEPSDIIVLTPGATELEVAAVTAVLEGALKELADEAAQPAPGRTPWQRSVRTMRAPIGPGHPGWGDFNG